jgi:hypothetical protein
MFNAIQKDGIFKNVVPIFDIGNNVFFTLSITQISVEKLIMELLWNLIIELLWI